MDIFTDITVVLAFIVVCFAWVISILHVLDSRKREGLYLRLVRFLDESDRKKACIDIEPEHLSVEGVMDVLKKEGYMPSQADETTVDFKKEGIIYRVSYSHNRMDMVLSFSIDKPDAEEESRVREICRQVSDTIIMADVFLDGPDNDGEFTILFKISMILRTKAEFAASFSEYMSIITELHSRFYKEYDKGEDEGVQDDEAADPAALTIGVSSKRIPS